jgi:hypothetical protein|nr:MAG TPA: hypothetical protein [Caudoviricetes sp.]
MKFAHELLTKTKAESDVLPGNIYPAKGGRKSPGTEWWLVVAVSETGAHCIGFNERGEPCSTASYLKGAMRERPVIGRCDLNAITLTPTERNT